MSVETSSRVSTLAAAYTKSHRVYEWTGIIGTVFTTAWLTTRIAASDVAVVWWTPLAALIGLLAADFSSGVVHWMFDTWGSVDTPFFGKLAIRTFRHHHLDANAITAHGFVETNGHNFMLSMLPAAVGVYITSAGASMLEVFCGMCLLALAFTNAFTGQIHKWAHQPRVPRFVQLLQRLRLIITPEHHAEHHVAPFRRNYCITIGWCNAPLRAIRFFSAMEWLVTAVTGASPREDEDEKMASAADR